MYGTRLSMEHIIAVLKKPKVNTGVGDIVRQISADRPTDAKIDLDDVTCTVTAPCRLPPATLNGIPNAIYCKNMRASVPLLGANTGEGARYH